MKSSNHVITVTLAVFLTTLLNGCVSVSPPESTTQAEDRSGCIQPTNTFAYEINDASLEESNEFPRNVLPSAPWQYISDLPDNINDGDLTFGADEIWLRNRSHNFVEVYYPFYKEPFDQYSVYEIKPGTWRTVSAKTADDTAIAYTLLPVGDELWAVNIPASSGNASDIPVFSRYERENNAFVPTLESSGIINIASVNGDSRYIALIDASSGHIWFLVQRDAIYRYERASGTLSRQFEFDNNELLERYNLADGVIRNASTAPDGSIYFSLWEAGRTYFPSNIQDFPLFRFNPETGTITEIVPQLSSSSVYSKTLVDSSGRLWFDSLGWLDPEGTWFQVHQPPLFVTLARESPLSSRMTTPKILLESTDGRLWFHHENGMISLDPEKGDWCWFTTYQSNIVEDADHNLWMIADGKLYKNPLGGQ